MDDLNIIIDSLGDQNELIDDDDLADIKDEIDTIDEEEYYYLAKIAIKLGKPQILEYLIRIYRFDDIEIRELCEEIKKYKKIQMKKAYEDDDSEEEEDIQEIIDEYAKIIKNCSNLPYKKNTHKLVSKN